MLLTPVSGTNVCRQYSLYLDTLAIAGATLMDVVTSLVTSDEANGLDVLVVANKVDSVLGTVNNVQDTSGDAGLLGKLSKDHGGAGVLLRGLEDAGVTDDVGQGEHPERDHGGEVEGSDTGNDTEGLADGVGVHVGGDLKVITEEQVGDGAGRLDNLKTAEDITTSIGKGLALLESDGVSDPVHVVADQELEIEHLALAVEDGGLLPGLEGLSGRVGSVLELLRGSLRNQSDDFLGGLKCMVAHKEGG